jgi:hypothetical protein
MSLDQNFLAKAQDFKAKLAGPFFIFETENLYYDSARKIKMTHDRVMKSLKGSGLDAHSMQSFDQIVKRAAIVYGLNQTKAFELIELSKNLGNEFSIWSDGNEIRKVYHQGKRKDRFESGDGLSFHSRIPSTSYYSLPYGVIHFVPHFSGDLRPLFEVIK